MDLNANSKTKRTERILLILYLAIFFSVALVIALLQPHVDTPTIYANPPDEPARYKICRYICRYGRLPNGYDPEVRIPGYGISYAFYTMLPYMVQGFFMRFVNLFTDSELILLYAARFVNVVTGTGMAAVVYGISRRLFDDRRFGWLFCILVMYLPQSLFVHTYVNTDSMCLFSTALIVYALVRAYQDGFTRKNCLLLSAGIIICALSYYNAYGFILSSIILFVGSFLHRKEDGKLSYDWKNMLKRGCLISVVVLLGIGWYFIRNAVLYDGDFLGLASMRRCGELYGTPEVQPYGKAYVTQGISVWQMLREESFFVTLLNSFIACYGSMSIVGPIWLYRFYKLIFLVGIAAAVVLRFRGETKLPNKGQRRFFHANMSFCIVMPVILCIYYAYTMDYQAQGRYVLPGLIPFMYFVTLGLEKLASLNWVPAKWTKTRAVLGKAADVALYAAMALVVILLFVMVFGCAVPACLETGFVM